MKGIVRNKLGDRHWNIFCLLNSFELIIKTSKGKALFLEK
jgi:hypothetical protein